MPPNQTAHLLRRRLPRQGGSWLLSVVFIRPESATVRPIVEGILSGLVPARKRNEVHREDLMKPDLLSEIVLLSSGGLIFVSMFLIAMAALTRA